MTHGGTTISWQAVTGAQTRWITWLRYPVYLGCAMAFTTDILHEVYLQFGLFYLPLVCTAVFHRNPRWSWWLASIAPP